MGEVVFYNIGWPHADLADCFIGSVRRHLPTWRITQLSDMDTPEVPGVDRVRRAAPAFRRSRTTINYVGYALLADLDVDDVLFLDMDMLVMGDLSGVVQGEPDVALCPRPTRDGMRTAHKAQYPYCSAMFVRTRTFWRDCYETMLTFGRRRFCDNMDAVGRVVNSGRYTVQLLDPHVYNRIPKRPDEYDPSVKIYHFKGGRVQDRRGWMRPFYDRHVGECAHA